MKFKQKTIKLMVRIISGALALLMICSILLMTGCSKQDASAQPTPTPTIDPSLYEPTWDDEKLTERDFAIPVSEEDVGDYYIVTVDWQNPDAQPEVSLTAPDYAVHEPYTVGGSSATFAVEDFQVGNYSLHIEGYGLGQISVTSYPYTGELQTVTDPVEETETETMAAIRELYESLFSTDIRTKMNLVPTTLTENNEIPFGYSADAEGFFAMNAAEGYTFMLMDSKIEDQADSVAMSAMDYVQAEMANHTDVKYQIQCWAVGSYSALLMTPADFDFDTAYAAINQFMYDRATGTQPAESEVTESEAPESEVASEPAESEPVVEENTESVDSAVEDTAESNTQSDAESEADSQ